MAQLVWIFIGETPQPSIMKRNLHIHEIHYLVFTYWQVGLYVKHAQKVSFWQISEVGSVSINIESSLKKNINIGILFFKLNIW